MNMNMVLKKTDLGFCMGTSEEERERSQESSGENRKREKKEEMKRGIWSTSSESDHHHNNHPVQLDLLPFSPVPLNHQPSSPADRIPFPWLTQNCNLSLSLSLSV